MPRRVRIFWPRQLNGRKKQRETEHLRSSSALLGTCHSVGNEVHLVVADDIPFRSGREIHDLRNSLLNLNEKLEKDGQQALSLQLIGVWSQDEKGKGKDNGEAELMDSVSMGIHVCSRRLDDVRRSSSLFIQRLKGLPESTVGTTISIILYDPPQRNYLRFLSLEPLRLSTASLTQRFRAGGKEAPVRSSKRPLSDKFAELQQVDTRPGAASDAEATTLRHTIFLLNQFTASVVLLSKLKRRPLRQSGKLSKRNFHDLISSAVWSLQPLHWLRAGLAKDSPLRRSLTVKQVELRLSQVLYWPVFATEIRKLRKDELAPVSDLAANYITLWGGVWLIANDIVIGQAAGTLLEQAIPIFRSSLQAWMESHLHQDINWMLQWLADWPLGVKLNSELTTFFGDVYTGLNALFHDIVLVHLIDNVDTVLHIISACVQYAGLTIGISLCADFLSLATLHLCLFHGIAAFLYRGVLRLLGALFHLFRGKKRNPLRMGRIDDASYEFDQMLLGTILFTLLLFLFPTISTYHLTAALVVFAVVLVQAVLSTSLALLNHLPLFALMLRIKDPQRLPGGIELQQVSKHEWDDSVDDDAKQDHQMNKRGQSITPIVVYQLRNVPLSFVSIFDGYAAHLEDLRRLPAKAARILSGDLLYM